MYTVVNAGVSVEVYKKALHKEASEALRGSLSLFLLRQGLSQNLEVNTLLS